MVGALYNVEIMLYDYHRVAPVYELVEDLKKNPDVFKMKSGGGLVEQEKGLAGVAFGQLRGEFHALILAAAQS